MYETIFIPGGANKFGQISPLSNSNNQQYNMDPTGGMVMAGIGYAAQGAMALYNIFSANRQMKRLGNRPMLTPPKELVEIQKKREEDSNKFQGFSQEMLTNSRNRAKGETASILNRAQMTGAPQNLVYAGLNIGRNAADLNLGAKSSILDTEQREIDRNAAESAAMKIGDIDIQNQVSDQQIYDQTLMALARQMQSGTQSLYNMSGALGTTGYGLAMNA